MSSWRRRARTQSASLRQCEAHICCHRRIKLIRSLKHGDVNGANSFTGDYFLLEPTGRVVGLNNVPVDRCST